MTGQGGTATRKSMSLTRKKSGTSESGGGNTDNNNRKSLNASRSMGGPTGERTVKRLRLSKALTVPDTTKILEACHKMAIRRVDALLLTDSNALLCGILTDKDILMRAIAREVNLHETPASKVMTRNPVFVLSDTLAVEALQKMVQGKFRHLPVVENGEVVALLDIAKCLYDAIARMERAAEKGKAIASAVEGVEKQRGSSASGSFIDNLREKLFKPSLSTIIPENSKIVTVSPSDTVLVTAKKMLESRVSCAIVTVENKPRGILTSKDILMRLIAKDLSADSTLVEKVMTPNPECATVDTPIVDALHKMHDGKYLHLPVVDRDGFAVAVIDVFHITHAAVATVGSNAGSTAGTNTETTNTMMQNFWDSAMALSADEDDDTPSENSMKMNSEGGETGGSTPFPSSTSPNTFAFKIEDSRGRTHRFTCDTRSLTDLITALIQRVGRDIDRNKLPQILYEDEDHDKVLLATDNDLADAVNHAKAAGWKGLRLFIENSEAPHRRKASGYESIHDANADSWGSAYKAVAAGAVLIAGLSILAYYRRSNNN